MLELSGDFKSLFSSVSSQCLFLHTSKFNLNKHETCSQCWASVADGGSTPNQHCVNVWDELQTTLYEPELVQCWAIVVDDGPTLTQHWFMLGQSRCNLLRTRYTAGDKSYQVHMYRRPRGHIKSVTSVVHVTAICSFFIQYYHLISRKLCKYCVIV